MRPLTARYPAVSQLAHSLTRRLYEISAQRKMGFFGLRKLGKIATVW